MTDIVYDVVKDDYNEAKSIEKYEDAEYIKQILKDLGYISRKSPTAVEEIKNATFKAIERTSGGKIYDSVLVICMGSALAQCRADNIGPLVGAFLKEKSHINDVYIYGTMCDPIDGTTFKRKLPDIYNKHLKPFVIAVDSAAVNVDHCVEHICVRDGGVRPGAGLGKNFEEIGEVSVEGVLVYREENDTIEDVQGKIQRANIFILTSMAYITASGIHEALKAVKEQGVILIRENPQTDKTY